MRKLFTYAIIIFQIGLIISLVRGIQLAVKARSRAIDLEARKGQLETERAKLDDELAYVRSDYYVEKVAREELQLGKTGETVVIIPDGQLISESANQQPQEEVEKANYLKWWDVVSGKMN